MVHPSAPVFVIIARRHRAWKTASVINSLLHCFSHTVGCQRRSQKNCTLRPASDIRAIRLRCPRVLGPSP